jgi:hypothetical protein
MSNTSLNEEQHLVPGRWHFRAAVVGDRPMHMRGYAVNHAPKVCKNIVNHFIEIRDIFLGLRARKLLRTGSTRRPTGTRPGVVALSSKHLDERTRPHTDVRVLNLL